MSHRTTTSRGVALLLALLAVTLVSAAALNMLRIGGNASIAASSHLQRTESSLIIDAIGPRLLAWLSTPDSDEQMGINSPQPGTQYRERLGPGLNRVASCGIEDLRITVDAIDLSGCLHIGSLDAFAADGLSEPLRSLRASDFTRRDRHHSEQGGAPVLAESIAALANERSNRASDAINAFPDRERSHEADVARSQPVVLQLTSRGDGALNVRTAPRELLEAALRGRDPAVARRMLDLRTSSQPIPDDLIARLDSGGAAGAGRSASDRYVPLTGQSSAAGFIVGINYTAIPDNAFDGSEGGALRRWWIVFERRGSVWTQVESRRID